MKFGIKLLGLFLCYLVLNASIAFGTELASYHCHGKCPVVEGQPSIYIVRNLYAMSFNPETKFANWVSYKVSLANRGSSSKQRNWSSDDWIGEDQSMTSKDYEGAYSDASYDRGHLAPLSSFSGSSYWSETNIMTNVVPQHYKLNRGAWRMLEERALHASKAFTELMVIDGVVNPSVKKMKDLPGSKKNHSVPTHLYKIIYAPRENGGEFVAFIFENSEKEAQLCESIVTLDNLQQQTGVIFFPKEKLFQESNVLKREIGCE